MQRLIVVLLLVGSLIACSSTSSYNQITEGEVIFKGGASGNNTWDDSLSFKKTSWIFGTTVHHELIIAELSKDSMFTNWLGKSEKSNLDSCERFYVAFHYSNINEMKAEQDLLSELDTEGLKDISLPHFSRSIKNHMAYQQWSLSNHKFKGFCLEKGEGNVQVSIPGFNKINVLQ